MNYLEKMAYFFKQAQQEQMDEDYQRLLSYAEKMNILPYGEGWENLVERSIPLFEQNNGRGLRRMLENDVALMHNNQVQEQNAAARWLGKPRELSDIQLSPEIGVRTRYGGIRGDLNRLTDQVRHKMDMENKLFNNIAQLPRANEEALLQEVDVLDRLLKERQKNEALIYTMDKRIEGGGLLPEELQELQKRRDNTLSAVQFLNAELQFRSNKLADALPLARVNDGMFSIIRDRSLHNLPTHLRYSGLPFDTLQELHSFSSPKGLIAKNPNELDPTRMERYKAYLQNVDLMKQQELFIPETNLGKKLKNLASLQGGTGKLLSEIRKFIPSYNQVVDYAGRGLFQPKSMHEQSEHHDYYTNVPINERVSIGKDKSISQKADPLWHGFLSKTMQSKTPGYANYNMQKPVYQTGEKGFLMKSPDQGVNLYYHIDRDLHTHPGSRFNAMNEFYAEDALNDQKFDFRRDGIKQHPTTESVRFIRRFPGHPLPSGYMDWLDHLEQNPNDPFSFNFGGDMDWFHKNFEAFNKNGVSRWFQIYHEPSGLQASFRFNKNMPKHHELYVFKHGPQDMQNFSHFSKYNDIEMPESPNKGSFKDLPGPKPPRPSAANLPAITNHLKKYTT